MCRKHHKVTIIVNRPTQLFDATPFYSQSETEKIKTIQFTKKESLILLLAYTFLNKSIRMMPENCISDFPKRT